MNKYIVTFKNALDGRSLKSETIRKAFNPLYKIGTNRTVDALKYLQELPEMVGENIAINFIEIVANQRAVGWKSLGNVVDLVMNHCDNPSEVIDEITTAMANRMLSNLDGVEPVNSGADVISAILYKHTGKSINEGQFHSIRSDAMIENIKTIRAIKTQIVNRLKRIDPNSRDAVLLRDVLGIETKSIMPLLHLVQVLTDEEKSA